MKKRNFRFKISLILLSLITIISLFYLKFILIYSTQATSYFPFYRSMTFLDYAGITGPGFFEFVAFICISIAYIFKSFGAFSTSDEYAFIFLGMLEIAILAVLTINLITFKIVHNDLTVIPGPTWFLLLFNSLLSIYFGRSIGRQAKKATVVDDTKNVADSINIQPISDVIKKKRDEVGMTQQKLADEVLVSRQTVHRWESGKSHPDMEYMIRVAKALDFPVAEFWGSDDDKMNNEIGNVVKRGKIYKQALYFLISIVIVIIAVFSVAFAGQNIQSPSLDKVNPFIKQEIGYVLVHEAGQQKAAVVDDEFGEGNVITLNGSYNGKREFVKIVHKGAYVKSELRNVSEKDIPDGVKKNLYMISHFNDPTEGLKNIQKSYSKRYI